MNPNLSAWAIRHRSFIVFLMLLVMVAGIGSYLSLGRAEDPAFSVKTMVVSAGWPGATLGDTLEQVTERLERKLEETPQLDFLRSYTSPGQTTIFVNLKGEVHGREIADIWYQVRKKMADIRNTLPQGATGPGFNDEFGDTYGIIYGFTADGFTQRELRDQVEEVRSRLLHVPDVSKIDVVGAQDEKIYLEFNVDQIAGLGLNQSALVAALQAQNAVTPAGVVQTGNEKLLIRVSGDFRSEQDLLAVNFVANGRIIRLSDIATVRRAYGEPPQPMFRVNGQPAIGLAIAMREGGDVLALGRNVAKAMATIKTNLPIGIEPELVADQPVTVEHSIREFMKTLWEAVAIILAISFISLGLRAGAVVALSIPLTLGMVFMTMAYAGIDLQRISLGALIISLGLLVDDAMITVETMITRIEQGAGKEDAATFAYTSVAFPMLTGSLITVAGFVPIGFARSSAGEYTFSIFAVVAMALIGSWFVAVLFSPLLGVWLLPRQVKHTRAEPGFVMRAFRHLLGVAMRMRWITILATLALFGLALVGTRFVPQQFFPASDRPELLVDLKLPQNASIHASEAVVRRLDGILKGNDDIEHWSTYVGSGAVRFYLPLNVQLPNDSFSQAVIVTKSLEARERVRVRLEQALETDFPSVVGRVYPLELGPPVGWPLQYRVTGPDLNTVREAAFKVADAMGTNPYVQTINFDWIEPARTLQIRVNQDEARLLGLSSQDVAQALNSVVTGATVTQVRDGIYLIDVVVRAGDEQRGSLAALRNLQLPLPNGRTVPITQLASVEYGLEYPLVWRRDRVPSLVVQADVAPGVQSASVVKDLAPRIAELSATLPAGYGVAVGGTAEESAKSQASVIAVIPLMMGLMLILLMVQLHSFQRMILVLSVAPLGLIGVVLALLLANKPLGFVAILGVLALVGMIARNSVILIDQVETERAHGLHPWDAVVEATVHRFRPILLTAAAAILGMIPIAPTVFWGPMAYAIMGGLAVATALTLVFLPALYVAWFRIRPPVETHVPAHATEPAPALKGAAAE
ncbi:efflux RND transporter permease subunit [Microvirga calopogonii]|uniref:efflux RND transporter permease subunit n=1 Tax=Microvirga calopogonii TaxID=2078013 RepID=UPI000E0DCD50|nr:efflux RND transporter permease subunit [Microvirga calopogonii]